MKKIVAILFILVMILTSPAAFAADEATNIMADALFLRPLGLVLTVFGTTFFVATLPMSAMAKSTDKTYRVFVKHPFEFTFTRPMGKMESGLEEF